MAIDIKKILTIRASDYFSARSISAHNYQTVGVHSDKGLDDLAEKVPSNAEIVTDYVFAIADSKSVVVNYRGSATAWVPKEQR